MAKVLCIKIVYLERAVVYMAGLIRAHEKGMVIDGIPATVDMSEDCHVLLLVFRSIHIEEVGGYKIEILAIKLDLVGEVLHAKTEMTEL